MLAARKAAAKLAADLNADLSLATALSLEDRLAISRVAYLDVDLKGPRGSPRKDNAARVAAFLAEHFKALTGLPPTRITRVDHGDGKALGVGGPFVDCLKAAL